MWEETDIQNLPGFHNDALHEALPALKSSCKMQKKQTTIGHDRESINIEKKDWDHLCGALEKANSSSQIKLILQEHATAYKIKDGSQEEGVFTGYYEPLLHGSLRKHGKYQTPLYKLPSRNFKIPRKEINAGAFKNKNLEIVWVDDPVDAFFLEIQGSGRVQLDNGKMLRVGYNGQNGYPYTAIGKILIEKNIIPKEKMNMHSLKAWLKTHPKEAKNIMNQNESYVFFKKLDTDTSLGPIGAQGTPLTPQRSIAVDPAYIPMGAPLWLDITHPHTTSKIQKMVVAQDKGGAIKGVIRGDYFWGFGSAAEALAGNMKSKGTYYLLLPKKRF